MSDPGLAEIIETLRACQQDQVRVVLYLGSTMLAGVVARLETNTVELREGTQRVVARLDRVDAVRRD